MKLSTTPSIPGKEISESLGVIAGEAILGVNLFRDLFAGLRDIIGGRSGGYQKALAEAREHAMADMMAEAEALGANAVVGIDIDYEAIGGQNGTMLMVSCSGTAVKI
ncbi:MAG: heavy metal-binding domain-containing protein [bacterium]